MREVEDPLIVSVDSLRRNDSRGRDFFVRSLNFRACWARALIVVKCSACSPYTSLAAGICVAYRIVPHVAVEVPTLGSIGFLIQQRTVGTHEAAHRRGIVSGAEIIQSRLT